jgi:uncharacterized OsmC-like protein/pimeloyl-ACP methyl ester carboxylesterase
MSAKAIRLEIPGPKGNMLAARLDLPTGAIRAYALFAHCFTCGKDGHAARRISSALTEKGIGVVRFDFTGLGDSEGDFASSNFSSNIDDLVEIAQFMAKEGKAPSLMIGHSLGGAAVLCASRHLDFVKAVACINAPATTDHLADLLTELTDDAGSSAINIGGRPFTITQQFLHDLASHKVLDCAAELGKPLLILHAPLDNIVGIDHARQIFEKARHPKSFVSLDDSDHLLSDKKDTSYAAEIIAAWGSRFLPEQAREQGPGVGQVLVRETRLGNYQNHGLVRGHVFTIDEPLELKGLDTGPTPVELLSAALGGCTSITLRMYADRKGWDVDGISVLIRQQRVEGVGTRFTRSIELDGALDEAQRKRMLEIADKCPVHKILEGDVEIITKEISHNEMDEQA